MTRGIECAAWGTVGRDPELKQSRTGTPYCSVNVAVTVGQSDDGKDVTQWCRVVAFKQTAEEAARALAKGCRCYFEGSLTLNRWQGSDGQERTDINVTAWKLERVGAIGRNKPKRNSGSDPQAPIERREPAPFNDDLGF